MVLYFRFWNWSSSTETVVLVFMRKAVFNLSAAVLNWLWTFEEDEEEEEKMRLDK